MREASLRLASSMCKPLQNTLCEEDHYHVESTGAIVTMNSSVKSIYFFCSKLPSDESVFCSLNYGFLLLHTAKHYLTQVSYFSHGSYFFMLDIFNLCQDLVLTRHWELAPCTSPRAVLYRLLMQKEKFPSSRRQFVLRPAENYMLSVPSQIISYQN
jgi:hypothetical protein